MLAEADVLTSFKYMMMLFKDVDGEHTQLYALGP